MHRARRSARRRRAAWWPISGVAPGTSAADRGRRTRPASWPPGPRAWSPRRWRCCWSATSSRSTPPSAATGPSSRRPARKASAWPTWSRTPPACPGWWPPSRSSDLRDPPRIEALLAAQEPMVPIGEPTYHALTYGWLCDALVRRVDGRTVGRFVADEIAGPLDLDLSIGTPPERAARAAEIRQAPNFALAAFLGEGPPDPRLRLRLRQPPRCSGCGNRRCWPWRCPPPTASPPRGRWPASTDAWPAAANSTACASWRPRRSSWPGGRCRQGHDPLSGRLLRFGVGFELAPNPSELGPEADAFGHTGSGGSSHGAWPALPRRLLLRDLRDAPGE